MNGMNDVLKNLICSALVELGFVAESDKEQALTKIALERPADMSHGDYATNIAMVFAKEAKKSPLTLAVELVEKIETHIGAANSDAASGGAENTSVKQIKKVEVAGPGFINFYLSQNIYKKTIAEILEAGDKYGTNVTEKGKKIAFEYTDPNPFKIFHIGHLMANTTGETLARLAETTGAEVKRFCYQGDVGRHIALTLWGLRLMDSVMPDESASVNEKVAYFGKAYALGATKYKQLEEEKVPEFAQMETEVLEINKKIYDRSDAEVNEIYDKGKEWSLEHFEELYKILGTKFDRYFFESQTAPKGIEIIKANTEPKGAAIFEVSNGATIFAGEKYGLHTRVFITKDGLPTYEGKDFGLIPIKYDAYNFDLGVIVTANEQDEYFKVVYKAASFVFPEIAAKSKHISHGMMKLTTGKMSSRTGDVITGESLLKDMIDQSLEKMKERDMSEGDKRAAAEMVAVAAIKYTVLRQSLGKDIIFDPEKSLSFEGDSGPYLQYSCVRANSILNKAKEHGIKASVGAMSDRQTDATIGEAENINATESMNGAESVSAMKLEKMLERYPEIVTRAWKDLAPHHVANYLMELAGTFNSFYANTQIVKVDDSSSSYKVALVNAFAIVMRNGLNALGIKVPIKM